MRNMFAESKAFNQPLDRWKINKEADVSYMFAGAKAFDQSLTSWDLNQLQQQTNMFLDVPIEEDKAF